MKTQKITMKITVGVLLAFGLSLSASAQDYGGQTGQTQDQSGTQTTAPSQQDPNQMGVQNQQQATAPDQNNQNAPAQQNNGQNNNGQDSTATTY
jgi:hypothetical protein